MTEIWWGVYNSTSPPDRQQAILPIWLKNDDDDDDNYDEYFCTEWPNLRQIWQIYARASAVKASE